MKRSAIILSLWLISVIFVAIWTYENPENIEYFKNYIKKNKEIKAEKIDPNEEKILANSFLVKFSKIISLTENTAFILYPDIEEQFDHKNLVIYKFYSADVLGYSSNLRHPLGFLSDLIK